MDTATSPEHTRPRSAMLPLPSVCDDGFLPPHTTVVDYLVTTHHGRVQVYEGGLLIVDAPASVTCRLAAAMVATAGYADAWDGRE